MSKAKNPIKYLGKTSSNFFYKENAYFCLNPKLEEFFNNPAFKSDFNDIIEYRTRKFFKERLEERYNEWEDTIYNEKV